MNSYVEFWFAVSTSPHNPLVATMYRLTRAPALTAAENTIGSAHLDEKYDHLDMERESHPDYPLKWPNGQAQLSLPRMVAQQFNSIGAQSVMGPMRNKILDGLSRMMHDKRPQYFFTVYVIVFIMLHEASIASADRRRYAEQNSEGVRRNRDGRASTGSEANTASSVRTACQSSSRACKWAVTSCCATGTTTDVITTRSRITSKATRAPRPYGAS